MVTNRAWGRLTEGRVIEEAERIADEVGLSRRTLAAIARRIGVRQPSLSARISFRHLRRALARRLVAPSEHSPG